MLYRLSYGSETRYSVSSEGAHLAIAWAGGARVFRPPAVRLTRHPRGAHHIARRVLEIKGKMRGDKREGDQSDRLAKALRDNLRKRKDQARARREPEAGAPEAIEPDEREADTSGA